MIDDPQRRASDLRLRHGLILVLAAHAGAMDALGLLALQAFTSVQTGNMILAGVGIATDDWRHVLQAVAAISCFAVGCVVSVRITGTPQTDDGVWPTEITRALCVQLVVMAFFCVGWWLTGSDPGRPRGCCSSSRTRSGWESRAQRSSDSAPVASRRPTSPAC